MTKKPTKSKFQPTAARGRRQVRGSTPATTTPQVTPRPAVSERSRTSLEDHPGGGMRPEVSMGNGPTENVAHPEALKMEPVECGDLSPDEQRDFAKLKDHPIAGLFPLMDDAELQALAADIRENGQHEDIVLYEGKILDGRNRYRACRLAGIEPRFVEWNGQGGSPVQYVISRNLRRRNLDESQRAMVGVQAMKALEAEAKARQLAGLKQGTSAPVAADLRQRDEPSRSSEKAAKIVNVSTRLIESAAKVVRSGAPELVDAVKNGEIPVSPAADVVDLPLDEQRQLVAQGAAGVKRAAKESRVQRRATTRAKRAARSPQSDAPVPSHSALVPSATVAANVPTVAAPAPSATTTPAPGPAPTAGPMGPLAAGLTAPPAPATTVPQLGPRTPTAAPRPTAPDPTPAPAAKLYDALYCQPFGSSRGRRECDEETIARQISKHAAPDAVLFMRAPAARLGAAMSAIARSGFTYQECNHVKLPEEKVRLPGRWFKGQTELLLVATRGNVAPPPTDKLVGSWLPESNATTHGPQGIVVAELYSSKRSRRLALFTTCGRKGWDSAEAEGASPDSRYQQPSPPAHPGVPRTTPTDTRPVPTTEAAASTSCRPAQNLQPDGAQTGDVAERDDSAGGGGVTAAGDAVDEGAGGGDDPDAGHDQPMGRSEGDEEEGEGEDEDGGAEIDYDIAKTHVPYPGPVDLRFLHSGRSLARSVAATPPPSAPPWSPEHNVTLPPSRDPGAGATPIFAFIPPMPGVCASPLPWIPPMDDEVPAAPDSDEPAANSDDKEDDCGDLDTVLPDAGPPLPVPPAAAPSFAATQFPWRGPAYPSPLQPGPNSTAAPAPSSSVPIPAIPTEAQAAPSCDCFGIYDERDTECVACGERQACLEERAKRSRAYVSPPPPAAPRTPEAAQVSAATYSPSAGPPPPPRPIWPPSSTTPAAAPPALGMPAMPWSQVQSTSTASKVTQYGLPTTNPDGSPIRRVQMEVELRKLSDAALADLATDLSIEHPANTPRLLLVHSILDKLIKKRVVLGECLGFTLWKVVSAGDCHRDFAHRLRQAVAAGDALAGADVDRFLSSTPPPRFPMAPVPATGDPPEPPPRRPQPLPAPCLPPQRPRRDGRLP